MLISPTCSTYHRPGEAWPAGDFEVAGQRPDATVLEISAAVVPEIGGGRAAGGKPTPQQACCTRRPDLTFNYACHWMRFKPTSNPAFADVAKIKRGLQWLERDCQGEKAVVSYQFNPLNSTALQSSRWVGGRSLLER
jgi:hypothetical protein